LLQELSDYDVIHCEDVGLLWAYQTGRPYVWHPYGFDLARFPNWSFRLNHYQIDVLQRFPEWLTAPIRYRRAIAGASFVQVGQWVLHNKKSYHLLDKLAKDRLVHLFLLIDTMKYRPETNVDMQELFKTANIGIEAKGLKIFHPTRIMFSSKTEYNFGSDLLLRVLKRFKDTGREFTFVWVRKGNSDEVLFDNLLSEYGLSENAATIPYQPRSELISWYNASDLVTNEFGFGGFGSISLEALACGTPLLTAFRTEYPDPTFFLPSFDSLPPIYFANSEDLALKQLILCADDPDLRERKAREGRNWILRNCSPEALAPRFLAMYQQALDNHPVDPIVPEYPDPTPQQLKAIELNIKNNDLNGTLYALSQALDDSPEHPYLLSTLLNVFGAVGANNVVHYMKSELEKMDIALSE
jgi:glycosyltransferase involved in cell wall biosynthesis